MKTRFVLSLLGIAAAAGATLIVYSGVYDISAANQHLAPTYHLLDRSMRQSVKLRARNIAVPPLNDPVLAQRGLVHFRAHCVQCHGAPGVAPEPFALGLTPAPANLVHTAKEWHPAEIFWVVKHGIKMTGMPAWLYRLNDGEIWATVAFMATLPAISPDRYRQITTQPGTTTPATTSAAKPVEATAPVGDAERGKRAMQQYICVTCHEIPGVVGANAPVGPPLDGIATRGFIGGTLPNNTPNMVRWLQAPQEVNPGTAMPDLGVSERDARDIAAYLQQLK